ncbi:MAG: hypothetical protein ACXVHW_09480 [Methanobacterium sp.]
MVKKCPDCGAVHADSATFCAECGAKFATSKPKKASGIAGITGWWNKQGKGMKIGSVIGLCCIGLLVVGFIGAMMTPNTTSSNQTTAAVPTNTSTSTPATTTPTPAPAAPTPEEVTISQLYGSGIAKGTLVKVTGKVVQSDGYNLRMENSNYQDILVEGSSLSAYEDQSVTVVGTFDGPTSYTTVMGGQRTVPTIKNAKIA